MRRDARQDGAPESMAVFYHDCRMAFFDMPKVASSTIKMAFHEMHTGEGPEAFEDPDEDVHVPNPTTPFDPADLTRHPDHWSFAVVRDPLARMLSAYGNRIANPAKLDQLRGRWPRPKARLLALDLAPDVDTFARRLRAYRLQSKMTRQHTELTRHWLGRDLQRFDAVYPIERLEDLRAELSRRIGREMIFRRLQVGGPKIGADALSRRAHGALMRYLAPDYDLLRDFYAPPAHVGTA